MFQERFFAKEFAVRRDHEAIDKSYGINWFTRGINDVPYAHPEVIIRDGKRRLVLVPNEAMIKVHRKIINCFRNEMKIHMPSVVCGPRISGNVNAIRHATNRHFLKLDLKDAFPSVSLNRLARMLVATFDDMGTEEEVRGFLREYCFDKRTGGLAQGLPASNDLFDFYCELLVDGPIREEVEMRWQGNFSKSFVLTRYVDGLFTSSFEPIPGGLVKRIREIIAKAGFRENHWKTQFHDATKNGPVMITGRSLDSSGNIFLPGKYLRRLEGVLWVAVHRPIDCLVSWQELKGHMLYFKHVMSDAKYLNRREKNVLKLFAEWSLGQRIDATELAEIDHRSNR